MKYLLIFIFVFGAMFYFFYGFEKYEVPQNPVKADLIVVEKSSRRMSLYSQDNIIKTYKIALGKNPVGAKEREGDNKTPEGEYNIVAHNAKSAFHKSLRISYPNEKDLAQARQKGVKAGGDIMIHGLPNHIPDKIFLTYHNRVDWTAGCIAVNNREIEEIWNMVPDGTKIIIKP
ncbi:MAG: L,D-transpeptidase family protein [Alphaproteobacteria bacterium]|nr:L,D-transpeptidase family protein [Alphaproteobacteria bacterium]